MDYDFLFVCFSFLVFNSCEDCVGKHTTDFLDERESYSKFLLKIT